MRRLPRVRLVIFDALPRALRSVAAPSGVMNYALLFGHLGRCYRNAQSSPDRTKPTSRRNFMV